jgi:hypothetical protein
MKSELITGAIAGGVAAAIILLALFVTFEFKATHQPATTGGCGCSGTKTTT